MRYATLHYITIFKVANINNARITMAKTTTDNLHKMSGYDCRKKCVFSFRRHTVNDEVDVMSSERLLQIWAFVTVCC